MMADALREGEDGEGQRRDLRDRGQSADHLERTKSELLPSSQKPLSSIRAAIKRTRTNSQSDNRERRRPEITIISAEPLASNNWFSGGSVVFSAPQSDWSAGAQAVSLPPPSYDQVIKEKTQEEHIVKPTAAPRRTTCTATSATQTDPVGEDVASHRGATPPPAERKPGGKKPQKPPRPSLPKGADRKPVAERDEGVAENVVAFANTEHRSDSESDNNQLQHTDTSRTCTRSVTVHWDIPTNHHPATAVPAEITPTNSNGQRPVPRPRIKTFKQPTEEEAQVDTLVKFSENSDNIYADSQELSTNKYLEELLEVFSEGNECEESSDIVDQSDKKSQGEDVDGGMNSNHSQRNIRARIQAFESQAGSEEGDVLKSTKPDPLPRRATTKPPVAAKPPIALKSRSIDDNNQNVPTTQSPTPAPRPQPPKKPVGLSVREELETLHSKGGIPPRLHPSVLTRDKSTDEEELSPIPPIPPIKPPKEPLKPNLNINNHNSTSIVRQNEYVDSPSSHNDTKPQHNVDNSGGSFTRQSVGRRPTTIRVPSKTDHFQVSPPPLPVQKPVGSLNTSVSNKQSLQSSFSTGPEPSLPPRKPTVNKTLPPRPPPAKTGPGRPPPPSLPTTSRSQPSSRQPSPKPQAKKPQRKGLVLPPRPSPGHRLYNKYTLELPHGIAAVDYNGSHTGELSFQKSEVLLLLEKINHNEFECQVGEIRGRVHKSRMKIITPLGPDSSAVQSAGPAVSDRDANGLKVQAVYDFIQEGPGELGLKAGDVVTMVEQVDSQWYRGTCRGSTGFFPISFVKVLSNSPRPLPERKTKPQSAPVSGPRCVARFDFEGEHSDELSFSEGDMIQLKEYVGDDWARGEMGVAMGIFPLNFVEIIEDLPPPPSQQQLGKIALPGMSAASPSMQPEAAKPAQMPESSVEWATALYDYSAKSEDDLSFQQGDCILITRHINEEWSCGRLNGREGMFPAAFVETTGQQLSKNHQNGTASGPRARALYNFPSVCEEELSLQVGDVITNLESIDEEWFLGDLRGKRALVPKNYVQVLE